MPLFPTPPPPALPLPPAPALHQRGNGTSAMLARHQEMAGGEEARGLGELAVGGEKKRFSECTGGSQSGWTLYLGCSQSSAAASAPLTGEVRAREDEEDDLSMLSDASSGPPDVGRDDYLHKFCCFSDDKDECFTYFDSNAAKRRRIEKEASQRRSREQEVPFFLEDTASSPCSAPPRQDLFLAFTPVSSPCS